MWEARGTQGIEMRGSHKGAWPEKGQGCHREGFKEDWLSVGF